jgi:hypothetical protein
MTKTVEPVELSKWALQSIALDIQELEIMYGQKLCRLDIDRIVTRSVSVATSQLISANLDKKIALLEWKV